MTLGGKLWHSGQCGLFLVEGLAGTEAELKPRLSDAEHMLFHSSTRTPAHLLVRTSKTISDHHRLRLQKEVFSGNKLCSAQAHTAE